tara:strand:+ start:87 stop:443 length:357 start_codon:yes stop_codon:yes gene_type:complete
MPPSDTDRRTARESREVPYCRDFWKLAEILASEDFDERGQVKVPPLVRCASPPPARPPRLPPVPVRRPLATSRETELNVLRHECSSLEKREKALLELCDTQRKIIGGLVKMQNLENAL